MVGDEWLEGAFSVGDIAAASCIRTLGYTGWQLDAAEYPGLAAWYGRVTERDGWKAAVAVEEGIFKALGI